MNFVKRLVITCLSLGIIIISSMNTSFAATKRKGMYSSEEEQKQAQKQRKQQICPNCHNKFVSLAEHRICRVRSTAAGAGVGGKSASLRAESEWLDRFAPEGEVKSFYENLELNYNDLKSQGKVDSVTKTIFDKATEEACSFDEAIIILYAEATRAANLDQKTLFILTTLLNRSYVADGPGAAPFDEVGAATAVAHPRENTAAAAMAAAASPATSGSEVGVAPFFPMPDLPTPDPAIPAAGATYSAIHPSLPTPDPVAPTLPTLLLPTSPILPTLPMTEPNAVAGSGTIAAVASPAPAAAAVATASGSSSSAPVAGSDTAGTAGGPSAPVADDFVADADFLNIGSLPLLRVSHDAAAAPLTAAAQLDQLLRPSPFEQTSVKQILDRKKVQCSMCGRIVRKKNFKGHHRNKQCITEAGAASATFSSKEGLS